MGVGVGVGVGVGEAVGQVSLIGLRGMVRVLWEKTVRNGCTSLLLLHCPQSDHSGAPILAGWQPLHCCRATVSSCRFSSSKCSGGIFGNKCSGGIFGNRGSGGIVRGAVVITTTRAARCRQHNVTHCPPDHITCAHLITSRVFECVMAHKLVFHIRSYVFKCVMRHIGVCIRRVGVLLI